MSDHITQGANMNISSNDAHHVTRGTVPHHDNHDKDPVTPINQHEHGAPNHQEDKDHTKHDHRVNCFATGTKLWSSNNTVRSVETLKPGDELICSDTGDLTTAVVRKVKWVGTQKVSKRVDWLTNAPVKIARQALGIFPQEDLYLSPEHAIFISGILVQAGALVNDITITREAIPDNLVYYHIEMEGPHTCLFASGLPAESFVDNTDRRSFDNWDDRAPTDPIEEMPYPRAKSARQVPNAVRELVRRHYPAITFAVS